MNLKKKFIFLSKNLNYRILKTGVINRKSGRNFSGKKTIRSRGFINKKKKRIIDYFRAFWHVFGILLNFEYDPNRNTLVSLVLYYNGIYSYIISLEKSFIGMKLKNGLKVAEKNGNCLLLKYVSIGSKICFLESIKNNGASFLRSSGSFGKVIKKNYKTCFIKLRSNKVKKFSNYCFAVIGSILNFNFYLNRYKKAGLSRIKGFRPKVRGVAMNPVDHPFGGGEGKKSKKTICMSPWGKLIKSKKTR